MTIQITRPEVEALINQRLEAGGFASPEDVIYQALQEFQPKSFRRQGARAFVDVCARIRGLADDLDLSRDPSPGREVSL